jgi:hypothetical protein
MDRVCLLYRTCLTGGAAHRCTRTDSKANMFARVEMSGRARAYQGACTAVTTSLQRNVSPVACMDKDCLRSTSLRLQRNVSPVACMDKDCLRSTTPPRLPSSSHPRSHSTAAASRPIQRLCAVMKRRLQELTTQPSFTVLPFHNEHYIDTYLPTVAITTATHRQT